MANKNLLTALEQANALASWLACAGITSAEDMAQSFPDMLSRAEDIALRLDLEQNSLSILPEKLSVLADELFMLGYDFHQKTGKVSKWKCIDEILDKFNLNSNIQVQVRAKKQQDLKEVDLKLKESVVLVGRLTTDPWVYFYLNNSHFPVVVLDILSSSPIASFLPQLVCNGEIQVYCPRDASSMCYNSYKKGDKVKILGEIAKEISPDNESRYFIRATSIYPVSKEEDKDGMDRN